MSMLRISILLLLLAHLALAQAKSEVRIFQLNNRPASATVEVVRAMLTPTGTVLPDERLNKLIVRDTPEALQRVADTLAQIDQPAPQVRIHVNFAGAQPSSGVVVGAGVPGGRVGAVTTSRGTRVQPIPVGVTANSYSTQATTSAQQSLLVMSGEKAHILVGQNIPYVDPYWSYANGVGLVPPGVVFQTVSTGFAVEPLVIGDNIRLKITPWLSYLSPTGRGQIEFAESSSTFNMHSGDTVEVSSGGLSQSSRTNAFGLILGTSAASSGTSSQIWVTAQIEQDYTR